MYPGSFDCDSEKNRTGSSSHSVRKVRRSSVPGGCCDGEPPVANGVHHCGDHEHDPRHQRQQRDRKVIPERLMMTVEIGGIARQVLLQKEDAEELGIGSLHRDEPRQGHGEIEHDAERPQRAQQQPSIAPQSGEHHDNQRRKKNSDRPFGQRSQPEEEIEAKQPPTVFGWSTNRTSTAWPR